MHAQRMQEARAGVADEFDRNQHKRPADLPQLPNLPSLRYTDSRFYELERNHLWTKTWLVLGHAGELPGQGSYKVWNQLGIPIILVRGTDDVIRAFYDVCRHRGGAIVADAHGKAKAFSCHFHGWTYA